MNVTLADVVGLRTKTQNVLSITDNKCIFLETHYGWQTLGVLLQIWWGLFQWLTGTDVGSLTGKVSSTFQSKGTLNACVTDSNMASMRALPLAVSSVCIIYPHQSPLASVSSCRTHKLQIIPFQSSPWQCRGIQPLHEEIGIHQKAITAAVLTSTHDALLSVQSWHWIHQLQK